MTERATDYLNPDWIASAEYGGCWVVGFVFSDRAAGIDTMKAIAELYNKTAARDGELAASTDAKEC